MVVIMILKEKAKKLKMDIPAIFLALKDKNTPVIARIFAGITVCYALSPIDLVPDFIPVLGYLDDIIILPVLVALTIKFIPQDVLDKNRKLSEKIWENGKPRRWYYAVPVVMIWIAVIGRIIKMVLG